MRSCETLLRLTCSFFSEAYFTYNYIFAHVFNLVTCIMLWKFHFGVIGVSVLVDENVVMFCACLLCVFTMCMLTEMVFLQ